MLNNRIQDLMDVPMSRKVFLQKVGRFTFLFGLLGLGGFLYRRNTCDNRGTFSRGKGSPCDQCSKLADCNLPLAASSQTRQIENGMEN